MALGVVISAIGLMIPGTFYVMTLSASSTRPQSFEREDSNLTEERGAPQQEIQRRLQQEISALEERLKRAEQAVEKAVIEKGILPELRAIINVRLPSYDTNLTIPTPPGFAEVFNPAYEVNTESKHKGFFCIAQVLKETCTRG